MKLELLRTENTSTHTIGVLRDADTQYEIARTLEDAWRDNKKSVSCIPEGEYTVVRHVSPKYGNCFMVSDVPNRDYILIHVGNYDTDTEGCILLGLAVTTNLQNKRMITNSKIAVDKFNNFVKDVNKFTLVIRRV